MRTIPFPTAASLGIFVLVAYARVAAAQTYVWTDERGVVHATAEASQIPAQYREKSVRDASDARPSVKVVPEDNAPVSAAPRATPIDTQDQPTPPPRPPKNRKPEGDEPEAKGKGLPPPDQGFEWQCVTDPEGGPRKCEQLEKKSSKRARRAAARAEAQAELGVGPTDEFDPEVAKRVNERAEQEFKKTTPVPTTKAPNPSENGDDGESGSGSDDEN